MWDRSLLSLENLSGPEDEGQGGVEANLKSMTYKEFMEEAQRKKKCKGRAAKGDGPHPLYGPPDFSLVLPQARTKNGAAQTIKDVTDHPWAGAEVVMTLTARDEGGNEGRSAIGI